MSDLLNCPYCQAQGVKADMNGAMVECWLCSGARNVLTFSGLISHVSRYNQNVNWKAMKMSRDELAEWASSKRIDKREIIQNIRNDLQSFVGQRNTYEVQRRIERNLVDAGMKALEQLNFQIFTDGILPFVLRQSIEDEFDAVSGKGVQFFTTDDDGKYRMVDNHVSSEKPPWEEEDAKG